MLKFLEKNRQRSNHRAQAKETGNHFKNRAISKKGLFLTLCIFAISSACFAQDIIVTKDSRKIKAKVVRINEENVRYKNFDDQEGQTITIPKSRIASILYEDGEVETFDAETGLSNLSAPTAPASTSTPVRTPTPRPLPKPEVNYSSQDATSTPQGEDASASSEEKPKTRWGIKAGLNSAAEYASAGNTNTRFGLHLGFLLESTLSRKVDIQPELVYSMQGGIDKDEITDKLDYINLPVMFKIYTNQSRTFSIDVGPQFGYLISAKGAYKGRSINIYDSSKLNKFDAAVCAGISYKFNRNFLFSFRINYSVTKIIDGLDNVNGVGQLSVGYML